MQGIFAGEFEGEKGWVGSLKKDLSPRRVAPAQGPHPSFTLAPPLASPYVRTDSLKFRIRMQADLRSEFISHA